MSKFWGRILALPMSAEEVSHPPFILPKAGSGIGIPSFSDAILPQKMREKVIALYPLDDWRLVCFRKDDKADPVWGRVERFLLASVLEDEACPAMQ